MTVKATTNGKPADQLVDHPAMRIGNKRRYTRPKCGRYDGVPFSQYLALPYVSHSGLIHACKSAAHYKHHLEQPDEPTDLMTFGTAVHALALQPETFDDEFAVEPDFVEQIASWKQRGKNPRGTTEYRERRAKWRRKHPGKRFLSEADYKRAKRVAEAVDEALPTGYDCEVSLIADCPETNLRIKIRIDVLDLAGGMIWDVKATNDASTFEGHIDRFPFRYDVQGALYQDVCLWVLGERLGFGIIAAETGEPFGVRKAPLSGDLLEDGRRDYCQALRRIRDAQHSGVWSGYTEQPYFRRRNDPRIDIEVDGAVMTIGR